jgi:hypothetical protein
VRQVFVEVEQYQAAREDGSMALLQPEVE